MSKDPEHNYECRNCRIIRLGRIIPSGYHCGQAGLHSWVYLGLAGNRTYECAKCKTLVRSRIKPLPTSCPKGSRHAWRWNKNP